MNPTGRRRVHLRIRGRVQGVYFRESTRQTAEGLGVVGWVQNLPDGSVEAVGEGPPEALEAWVTWCGRGPPLASVASVDRMDLPAEGDFSHFEVRRTRL